MTVIRGAVLGLLVLAASTGCATVARSSSNGNGSASPATYDVQHCEGWYDTAAQACDSIGD